MTDMHRFSITMPTDLLKMLDNYTSRRGLSANRSETIRGLVRDALINEATENDDAFVFGTLTMTFDHHHSDIRDKLDDIQHNHLSEIISTMHVHIDHHNCLEVIIMKGKSADIRGIADTLLGTKGVIGGQLMVTTVEHNN